MVKLSERVRLLRPSATLAVNAKAAELRAQGKDVISLAVGEPELPTPAHVAEAAIQAIHDGLTRYTPAAGIPELRKAVAEWIERELGLVCTAQEVVVTVGAKQALFNLMLAVLDYNDEVIIPAPYWVSYPEMAKLAGARVRIVPTREEDGFRLQPHQLAAAITPRTRLLILNSPSNPTGICYDRPHLEALAEVLRRHARIVIASDEIYRKIVFDRPHVSLVQVAPDLADRTVIIDGVSKAWRMTGWRIGFAIGPRAIIDAMIKIQGQSTSNACSIAQKAALAAIQSDPSCVAEMVERYRRRRDWILQRLGELPGVRCIRPEGAFYLFASVERALRAGETDVAFCTRMLEEAGVALVPGSAFGAPGYVRISYATSEENLEKALDRLARALG